MNVKYIPYNDLTYYLRVFSEIKAALYQGFFII